MYDDRPSLITEGLLLGLAWLALYAVSPALASFWHIDSPPDALLGAMALFAVCAARWPWLYSLLVPAGVYAWNRVAWLQQGLRLDFTVWWTDLRLGYWPGPAGLLAWAFLLAVILALGLLFVREPLARGRSFWTLAVGTLILGHLWLWGGDLTLKQYSLFLMATVPLWAAGAATFREYRWWQAGRRVVQAPQVVFSLLVAVLAAGLAAWVIPAPSRGLELGAVTAWARETFPAMEAMRGSGDPAKEPAGFTLAQAGFARRVGELGGPVKLSADTAMTVRFLDAPPAETLYLRGSAMTRYTGRGWAPDTQPGDVGGDVPAFGREITMEITPKGYTGSTLFYPREMAVVRGPDFTFGREGQVVVRGPRPTSYQVLSYLPAGKGTMLGAPQYNPGRYLALPKSLPARVGDLAEQIAKGQPTPYDEALAIEKYLRGFDYTLDVPATPPGRDFADYFLFDLKRGYCAYSATAMVVMLRTLDIPARWVQGFVVDPGMERADVPWSNAHAWVEAYFPGYGWTLFDPTPRFSLPARAGAPQQAPSVPGQALQPVWPDDQGAGDGTAREAVARRAKRSIPWVPAAVAVALLAWLATSFRAYYRERIDWRNERSGLLRAYAMLTGALRRMGLGRRAHETPVEYARAVGGAWPEMGEALNRVAADVNAAGYAPLRAPAPQGARRRMGGALAALWHQARRRFGLVRTAWIRLRFLWGKD